jgi:hypothetical protein
MIVFKKCYLKLSLVSPTPSYYRQPLTSQRSLKTPHDAPPCTLPSTHQNNILCQVNDSFKKCPLKLSLISPTPSYYRLPMTSKKVKNHLKHHTMPLITPFHLPTTHQNNILCPVYDGLQKVPPQTFPHLTNALIAAHWCQKGQKSLKTPHDAPHHTLALTRNPSAHQNNILC